MDYKVVITIDAEQDFERHIRYLLEEKKNESDKKAEIIKVVVKYIEKSNKTPELPLWINRKSIAAFFGYNNESLINDIICHS